MKPNVSDTQDARLVLLLAKIERQGYAATPNGRKKLLIASSTLASWCG